jgi:hypothetical protein
MTALTRADEKIACVPHGWPSSSSSTATVDTRFSDASPHPMAPNCRSSEGGPMASKMAQEATGEEAHDVRCA